MQSNVGPHPRRPAEGARTCRIDGFRGRKAAGSFALRAGTKQRGEVSEDPAAGSAPEAVDLSVATSADVYYTGEVYWNTFTEVAETINVRVSGRADVEWPDRFRELVGGRTFERALILNCGSGRVERDMVRRGLIERAVGVDILPVLLDEARGEAEAAGLAITYEQMDVNRVAFPDGPFDLVVNHAAGHHIRYIDRVFRALCRLLPEDGWFVNFDYVGPHRNQYEYPAWEAVQRLNEELPDRFRQEIRYPHLPTAIADDPTEAIHSELILETFQRYFSVDERADVGGALAYPLLVGQQALLLAPPEQRRRWLDRIMEADELWLKDHPGSTLFAFFAGRPRKDVLDQIALGEAWTAEEEIREAAAEEQGGEYYPRTTFQATYLSMVDEEINARHRLQTLDEWREELTGGGNGPTNWPSATSTWTSGWPSSTPSSPRPGRGSTPSSTNAPTAPTAGSPTAPSGPACAPSSGRSGPDPPISGGSRALSAREPAKAALLVPVWVATARCVAATGRSVGVVGGRTTRWGEPGARRVGAAGCRRRRRSAFSTPPRCPGRQPSVAAPQNR